MSVRERPPFSVGCAGFPVEPDEYASELNFVEVQETFVDPPAADALPGGRDFTRALLAWQVLTHPRGDHSGLSSEIPDHAAVGHFQRSRWTDEAWDRMDTLARAVRASAVLFRTPPTFTPTTEHALRLENFVAHAERPGLLFAWEWSGTWTTPKALALCERLGMVPVIDPTSMPIPDAEIVYLRVSRRRGSTSEASLARIADATRGREGFLVFEGPAAWEDARRLVKML